MPSGPEIDLSLVLPAYNEADGLESVVEPLARALGDAGISYELVLVDNGSSDNTGTVIDQLALRDSRVRKVVVPVNRGFGWGILCGMQWASGQLVGYMGSDGQVSPEDVVQVYRLSTSTGCDIAKVRRTLRDDGFLRRVQSLVFNSLLCMLFGIRCADVNGSPKILPRGIVDRLALSSRDWFLDAEVMIKARRFGLSVAEHPIRFRVRVQGRSHVRASTTLEFLRNILRYRLRNGRQGWSESKP